MSDLDLLDRQLTRVFERAHHAPEWSSPNWPDPAARVRRAAIRMRARHLTAATLALAAVAGGTVVAVRSLPGASDQVHYRVGSGGDGTATSGDTGAEWLLTPAEYERYQATHPTASPAPDLVSSPAPVDAELTQLQKDVAAAVPDGSRTVRADAADGGLAGHATVWLRLADGTPVDVQRYRLDYPLVLATSTDPAASEAVARENFTEAKTWADGTAYTVVTGSGWGYGFDENTRWSGPYVWTVTTDGWYTLWTAPVSPDRLLSWAQSADAAFAAG